LNAQQQIVDFEPEPFEDVIREARSRLLQMHHDSGVGHIGGNLSCIDILMTLFHRVLSPDDAFILSKGHAAGALYTTLWSLGRVTDEELEQFHKDGTKFSGHPSPNHIADIPFATGSLGHGLSLAAGLALGKSFNKSPGRVFCVTSDGEWQEGSTWEALMFASHRPLSLTVIVDSNGLQGFGTTTAVAGMPLLTTRLRAFGVPVTEIDGHDIAEIERVTLSTLSTPGPQIIVARTHKGSGVSFMQDKMEWHYLPLKDDEYRQAVQEIWKR
jgi:transketolase